MVTLRISLYISTCQNADMSPVKSEQISHIIDLLRLPDINALTSEISNKHHFANAVMSTYCNLDTWCTWFQLLFLEALYFKYLAPKINDGSKVIRDFVLFR